MPKSKYTPEQKRKLRTILVRIIRKYSEGGNLEELCYQAGLATNTFYGLLSTFELGERFRAAKKDHKVALESKQDEDLSYEEEGRHYEVSPHTPSVPTDDNHAVFYYIAEDSGPRDRCEAILQHYLDNTDKSMMECIPGGRMTEAEFFTTIARDKDLTDRKEEVKELREIIVQERLEFEKRDALNQTTREIFSRVKQGNLGYKKELEIVTEGMYDKSGTWIGERVKKKEKMVEDKNEATINELKAALSLLNLGETVEAIPDTAVEADSLKFDPSMLPDLVDNSKQENLDNA